jgi:carboxylesterase type B
MTWAPAVDGEYVPKPAGLMMKQGLFDHSLKVLTGHNSNEGAIFGLPIIDNGAQYLAYLHQLIPDATNSTIEHVNTVLYPPVLNGIQQYLTQGAREVHTITDSAFICNTRFIDVAPGYHAQDVDYTIFNEGRNISGAYEVNVTLAQQMQRMFTNFAKTGSPDGDNVPILPLYGKNSTLWSIQSGSPVLDSAAIQQCDWWQEAHYLPRW